MSHDYSPFYSEASSISEQGKKEIPKETKPSNETIVPEETPGRQKLRKWLNRNFRIVMTDGRILIGEFLCTDADANVILGLCSEYTQTGSTERFLGLVMVPGRHIISMEVDASRPPCNNTTNNTTYVL